MILYFNDEKAIRLQTVYDELLLLLEASIKTSWNDNKTTGDTPVEYGPDATVQTILAQRNNVTENNNGK